MNVSDTLAAWRTRRRAIDGCSIGFVPTMGALHRGHSSLVERCRGENLLQSLGVDEVIVPSARELYPNGYRFRVEPHGSDLVLEGAHRPGFLQGVMTVVLKLLNLGGSRLLRREGLSATEDHQRDDAGVLPSYTNYPVPDGARGFGTGDEFPKHAPVGGGPRQGSGP